MTVRIDKWLWAARFYKTRSQASEAVAGGHIRVNDSRCKPSRTLQAGDTLQITRDGLRITVVVKELSDKRGSAPQARLMYEETAESIAQRELQSAQRKLDAMANPRPDTRPDKRQRRQLKKWRETNA